MTAEIWSFDLGAILNWIVSICVTEKESPSIFFYNVYDSKVTS